MKFIQANAANYTVGRGHTIDHIVIHYTGNDGDTAQANALYFQSGIRSVSSHYFVDENEVVQSVKEADRAWHAGDKTMNDRSIGIEMCSKKDASGKFYIQNSTIKNAQELTKELMSKYNIPVENVIRHYDVTGKQCPEPFVRTPVLWTAFKEGLTDKKEGTTVEAVKKSEPSAWAKEDCEWAVSKGIFKGDDTGDMKWQDPVTREQLAIIIHRLGVI